MREMAMFGLKWRIAVFLVLVLLILGSHTGCHHGDRGGSGGAAGGDRDIEIPGVVEVSPSHGADSVIRTTLVEIVFEAEITADHLEHCLFWILGPTGPVPHRATLLESVRTVVLNPFEDLDPATEYIVEVEKIAGGTRGIHFASTFYTRVKISDASSTALFDPGDCTSLFPYPSDVFTAADPSSPTGLWVRIPPILVPPHLDMEALNGMDGFSYVPRIHVSLSCHLDPGSLPAADLSAGPTSPLYLIDMDPDSDGQGERIPIIAMLDHFGLALRPRVYTLRIETVGHLRPGTRYALVLTRRLEGVDCNPIEASDAFRSILDGRPAPEPHLERAWRAVGEAVAFVTGETMDLPLDARDLALAIPFTTRTYESVTGPLLAIRDALAAQAEIDPPQVTIDSVTPPPEPEAPETEEIAAEVTGTFPSPDFRGDCGTLDPDYYGSVPITAPMVDLAFLLTLPRGAELEPAPVAIFLHGVDDTKELSRVAAEVLAGEGIATIGIDMVEHGSRATGPTDWIWPMLRLIKFERPAQGRDNIRQTAADLMQLVQVLRTGLADLDVLPFGAPDGRPDLDPSELLFYGNSMGSSVGAIFMAIEPEVGAGFFSVPMGPFTGLMLDLGLFQPNEPLLGLVRFGLDVLRFSPTRFLELGILYQELYEPGEPSAYSPFMVSSPLEGRGPKNVLYTQVVDDPLSPASPTNEALARWAGLPLMIPYPVELPGMQIAPTPAVANLPGGITGGFFHYDRVNCSEPATHVNIFASPESLAQSAEFLGYYVDHGIGRIVDPY